MFIQPRLLGAVLALVAFVVPVSASTPEKIVPPDAEMVMSFNLKNMMASKAFHKHFKEMMESSLRENAQVNQVLSAINLDPMKDLHSISVALSDLKIDVGNPQPEMNIFVVVQGNFDLDKIQTAMALAASDSNNNMKISSMGSRKLYEFTNDDRTMYGVFVDNKTAILADKKDRLASGIERAEGKSSGGPMNKEFAKVMSRVDTKRSMWMASIVPASIKDLAKLLPRGEVFEQIEGLVFSLNVTDGLGIEINIYTTERDAAQQIKDFFQEQKENLGPLTLQIPDADLGAEVADVISKMKISQNDKTASISLDIGAGTLDKIVKFVKESRLPGNE